MNPKVYYEPFQGKPSLADRCPECVPAADRELLRQEKADWYFGDTKVRVGEFVQPFFARDFIASALWESSINAWARELLASGMFGLATARVHIVLQARDDESRNAAAHALLQAVISTGETK